MKQSNERPPVDSGTALQFAANPAIASRLDPGSAPAEVKQALRNYTPALEGSLAAMKAGRDTAQYDAQIAGAKQRLAECFRKYR